MLSDRRTLTTRVQLLLLWPRVHHLRSMDPTINSMAGKVASAVQRFRGGSNASIWWLSAQNYRCADEEVGCFKIGTVIEDGEGADILFLL